MVGFSEPFFPCLKNGSDRLSFLGRQKGVSGSSSPHGKKGTVSRKQYSDPAGAGGGAEGKGVLSEMGFFLENSYRGGGIWLSYREKIGFTELKKEIVAWELSLIPSLEARKSKACSENGNQFREGGRECTHLKAGNEV